MVKFPPLLNKTKRFNLQTPFKLLHFKFKIGIVVVERANFVINHGVWSGVNRDGVACRWDIDNSIGHVPIISLLVYITVCSALSIRATTLLIGGLFSLTCNEHPCWWLICK